MDNSIKLIIHKGSTIYDSVIVTSYSAIKYQQKVREEKHVEQMVSNIAEFNGYNTVKINKICLNKRKYNAYVVSAYVITLINSQTYRKAAMKRLLQCLAKKHSDNTNFYMVLIKLHTPRKQILDYKWNERITQMVLERKEVDHAMSWLSTLGGAFSALGEEFQHCAEMAGKISIRQFELALRLGDPLLAARCKLYAALSLIQRGQLKLPRKIVITVYKLSIDQNDTRLQKMCHGVWAKLKYCSKLQKDRHKNI